MRKLDPKFTLVPDGIHPDADGHMVMAYALAADLGLPKRVSTIDVSLDSSGGPVVTIAGGKLMNVGAIDGGVEFTYLADALPLPVPAEAETGAKLIPLGHRLGLEALYVHGLAPGRYRLSINEQAIGVYTSQTLESKLELQGNELTPQYRQAMQVAELNARRTTEAIMPLRDLWKFKKILTRTQNELKLAPDDVLLKRRVASQSRAVVDFDQKLESFENAARKFEDEIYSANQPMPLRVRIESVVTGD